ncbi:hypothetical protein SNE40_017006 [Patella caerulea]|uniref:C2H2-type domain-containing protein n=1 Tax=Patella caerulea TaxID=87958 RepID=A0AAN8JFW9_PATCE
MDSGKGYTFFKTVSAGSGGSRKKKVYHSKHNKDALQDYERDRKCPICGKQFTTNSHLRRHVKVHDQVKFKCEVCSKLLSSTESLKKHQRIHSGYKPYKCEICQARFAAGKALDNHIRKHLNNTLETKGDMDSSRMALPKNIHMTEPCEVTCQKTGETKTGSLSLVYKFL